MNPRLRPLVVLIVLAAAAPACRDTDRKKVVKRAEVLAPTPYEEIAPPLAEDLNPDPNVVEVVLVAGEAEMEYVDGKSTRVLAYNGMVPGPTIEANLGDTLVVHLYNGLAEDTTIHWHGLELPAEMDGSNISQIAVPPGGYFRYEFELLRAAMFWYHPHVNTAHQIEMGLHGTLLVRSPAEEAALGLPANAEEHVLVLDDVLLGADGQVLPPDPADPIERAMRQLNGREGNVLLVNGRPGPDLKLAAGIPHRLRVLNASNARFMRLSFPGQTVWRVGGDGGLLESPIAIPHIPMVHDSGGGHAELVVGARLTEGMVSDPDPSRGVLLTPAERADLVLIPDGGFTLEWHDFPRGRHAAFYLEDDSIGIGHIHDDGKRAPLPLLNVVTEGSGVSPYTPPLVLRAIDAIDAGEATAVVPVRFGHSAPNAAGDVTFFAQMVDGGGRPFDLVTAEDAARLAVGQTVMWEVWNMTGGAHNFHTHGFHFQHVETEFVDMDTPGNNRVVPADRLEDKDTIFVPARPGAMGRSRAVVRLVARMSDSGREGRIVAGGKVPVPGFSGGWLFHCHILEHSRRGMMSFFQVDDPE